jgi:1,4-dihydroxy-2-naphthoyl-CoA synthase
VNDAKEKMSAFLADHHAALMALVQQGVPGDEIEKAWQRVCRFIRRQADEIQQILDAQVEAADDGRRRTALEEQMTTLLQAHELERSRFSMEAA